MASSSSFATSARAGRSGGLARPQRRRQKHDAQNARRRAALPAHTIARLGLQLVPEERRIFGGLTVDENLDLATLSAPSPLRLDEVFDFLRLRERRTEATAAAVGWRATDAGNRARINPQAPADLLV